MDRREYMREYMRERRAADPESEREQRRRSWEALKSRDPEYFIRWRKANKAAENERTRNWKKENYQYVLTCNKNRAAIRKGADGSFTADDIDALFDAQDGHCLCGVDISDGFHIDHKTPITRGGSNWPENLQLLCAPCNLSKATKTMDEWSAPNQRT